MNDWQALRAQEVPEIYVKPIQDMYEGATIRIRCTAGMTDEFEVKIGVHQGSVLSPLLFILVIFFLTKDNLVNNVWALLFADDVVLGSEGKVGRSWAQNQRPEDGTHGLYICRSHKSNTTLLLQQPADRRMYEVQINSHL